ncbi:MAG: hypothetical protein GXO66_01145 [Euryarchaeota archaeon]|nr:hypothetical protein [Euryarchaeota archaeon]
MISEVLLPLLLLSAIYGLVILGLTVVLRRMGIFPRWEIALSFLIFGGGAGLLAAWVWPGEACVLLNVFAVFLGDEVYRLAILHLGDISSPQAHYTIPWILRIPQVYVVVSVAFWGLVGLLLQSAFSRRKRPPAD